MQTFTDNQLREQAHKRVEFRTHLFVFLIINGFLWAIWALTWRGYPWPVWPMFGWGLGLLFHYLFDYRRAKFFSEEEEYQKLKRQNEKRG